MLEILFYCVTYFTIQVPTQVPAAFYMMCIAVCVVFAHHHLINVV